MDFGVAFTFGNPKKWRIPDARFCQSQIDQAVLAEQLGFDHIWVASHPGSDFYYPSQFPLLAAIAARTSTIRLGTYILVLPLYHPLQVTEEAVTVDVISNGRLELGLGIGNFRGDFAAYGVSPSERGSRMEEGLTIIKGLWTEETFSFEGKHYKIPPFSLQPRPIQKKPPLWVAATVEKAFDRAARFECHLAGTGPDFKIYDEKLQHYGHDPKDFNRAIIQIIHIADNRARAWEEAAPHLIHFLKYYKKVFDQHNDFEALRNRPGGYFGIDPLPSPDELDEVKQLNFLGAPFTIGDPEDVIKAVSHMDSLGVTHLSMEHQFRGMDPRLVEHSMRLCATEVMPQFRK